MYSGVVIFVQFSFNLGKHRLWRYSVTWVGSVSSLMLTVMAVVLGEENCYCVVPENIHTPTTEGISYRTPPPLRIFHFREDAVTPPPPWKFQKLSNTPHTPWKLYSSQQTTNKRPCIYRLVRIWDNVVNVACVRRLKVANYPKYLTLTLLSYVYRSRSKT